MGAGSRVFSAQGISSSIGVSSGVFREILAMMQQAVLDPFSLDIHAVSKVTYLTPWAHFSFENVDAKRSNMHEICVGTMGTDLEVREQPMAHYSKRVIYLLATDRMPASTAGGWLPSERAIMPSKRARAEEPS